MHHQVSHDVLAIGAAGQIANVSRRERGIEQFTSNLERQRAKAAAARLRGDEGNRRLHQRWVTFIERRKRNTVANVAIARELAGWCWSLAVMEE